MPKIIVRQGRNANTEYKIEGEKFTMGRRKASDIPVGDPKSSRNHAEIFKQGDHYYVRDLASRNGTFLNGERLAGDTQLSFGDKVSIGDTIMEFVGDSAGKPIDFEIPGYQIQERIGEGGMGVVYKARQVSMDRTVALKVLSEKYSANSEFIDRFIREARAAGRLNHPNVIHVHDVSKAGGRYFFSMEYIDGPTVKELLKEKGRLPVKQSVEIITQAGKALEFAHENSIIHRDIKPDNIMLTSEGIVKLADLGIAKSFEDASLAPTSDGMRRVMGTPHYMAPEQALGKSIDRRADLYSLGATFYHMLTGKTPFKGSTVTELLRAHVHEKLEPIQHLNSEVPEPVCFVVERMMAKSPDKRYDDMTRLLEDLGKVTDDKQADIERLPPEESSIMAAAEAAQIAQQRAEARPARARASKPVANLVMMAVLLLLAGCMAVGAYIFVSAMKDKKPNGGTRVINKDPDPPPPPPPGTGPEQLLADAESFLQSNMDAQADARAEQILKDHLESPQAKRALEIRQLVKTRGDNALQAEVNLVIEQCRKYERDNPKKYGMWIAEWDRRIRAVDKLAGTDAVTAADKRIAEIRKQMTVQSASDRREQYEQAIAKSQTQVEAEDYVQAVQTLSTFVLTSGKLINGQMTEEGKIAEARAKEIAAAADKMIKDADVQAGEAFKSDQFSDAIKVYSNLKAKVKSASWLKDIPGKIQGIKDKTKAAYDAAAALVLKDAKAANFRLANRKADSLERRFRGTEYAKGATALRENLQGLPKLQKKMLDAVKKDGPRKVTFKMEAALFPGVKWRVLSANDEKITLRARRGGFDMDSPLKWSSLSARDTYNLYMLYMTQPSKADHRLLAFFCEIRGLSKEAGEHKKKAN
jgi:eukaryotic-like serine/threonine-protein kinase